MATLEDFVKHVDKEVEILELSEQAEKDSRPNKKDKANEKLRKYAYEALKDLGAPGIDFSRETPKTISDEYVKLGISYIVSTSRQDSSIILNSNFDDITKNLKKESLEKIALTKEIQEKGAKGYSEVLGLYQQYFGIQQLVDKYEKGEPLNNEEKRKIVSGGAMKAEEEMRKKLKDKGYSKDLQDYAGALANIAAKEGHIKEDYIKAGAKNLVKEAEKEFRDYEKDKGKSIVDYVRDSLDKLRKGDTKEFETAKGLVYQVAKGKI